MSERILVPLDGSRASEQVLSLAVGLARSMSATLELVRVHEPPVVGYSQDAFHSTLDADAEARHEDLLSLQKHAFALANEGISVRTTLLDAHSIPDALCAHATSIDAQLIVMATHGRTGLRRAVLGSISDAVVARATHPVLLWPVTGRHAPPASPFQSVLVALDGSIAAERIIPHAALIASFGANRVTLLRVVAPAITPELTTPVPLMPFMTSSSAVLIVDEVATQHAVQRAQSYLGRIKSGLCRARPELSVDARVIVDERIDVAIAHVANQVDADLLALAPQGSGMSRFIPGSTVDALLRDGSRAMLLLRRRSVPRVSG